MWGSSSGPRSRVPGRPDSSRDVLISDEVVPINSTESENETSSNDEKSGDVVAAVVVDEQAIVDGVRAAQYNMVDDLRQLIDSGRLTANTKDSEDCTLLQWGAINNRKDIVQELLIRGADVNAIGGFLRETALQWAVRQGALESTVILVQNGADPHIQGTEGLNVMHLALQFQHLETVLYLCSSHPSLLNAPTSFEKGSQTPLMFLVSQWGKQKATRDCARKWTDLLRMLVSFGASVNAVSKTTGDTALHCTMRVKNDVDAGVMFRELAAGGAKLDIKNGAGETVSMLASSRHRKTLGRLIHKESRKESVPSVTGFLTPWLQISSGAWLTSALGWFMGCALFIPACGVLGMISDLTTATQNNVAHGFAASSMFFIVGSFFVYLVEEVTSTLFFIWYILSVGLLVFFFVKTTLTEPGYVQSPQLRHNSSAPDPLDSLESGASASLISNTYSAADTIRGLAVSGDLHAALICSSCLIEKPRRSKHCSTCGHCVSRFDHHCPFVNTCIGRDNIGHFIGFITFSSLAIGSHLCIALPFIWNQCPDKTLREDFLENMICTLDATPNALIVITGLAMVHFLWITILGIAQYCQIYVDMTTYEAIRGEKRENFGCGIGFANLLDIISGRPSLEDRKFMKTPTARTV
mmetsp:Transcript_220/g.259  ORF Transcript_220/g.259 Transcript_220/m.259 type:complete len:639 (+) Transcript_220:45-1961(+)